ncbi:MAG: hypothetical protein Q7U04_04675 [Bacteriovorax sp.]|nr:hypothetical protein [Bacteriovorax sp.]
MAQIGYQEIIWGDAFGFNYADIINPKDQRETFFSDASDARLPLLLFNGKSLFSSGDFSGSLQVLFSPEPRFSKTLPLDIFIGNIFPQETLSVSKEKTPKIFSKTEFGGKISGSYNGYDMSIFSFSYLDREPIYAIENLTATNIALKEEHNKLKTTGLSFTKTVFDFVLRTDLVYSQNKYINYLENFELTHFTTNSLDTVISLDSPSYNDYSAVLVLARSNLGNIKPNSFREQTEQYLIGKIAKNLGKERSLEFSYTHEFEHPGHSIQTFLNWPITNQTELKIGGEFYFGDEQSNLSKFKKINSLFFSIKNYFQL